MLKRKHLMLVYSVCLLLITGCHEHAMRKQAFIQYLEKNKNISKSLEAGGIKIQARYYPYQLVVLQEVGENDKLFDTAKLTQAEEKYSSQYYFRLYFSKNNKEVIRQLGDYSGYSEMVNIFSFELAKYINITTPAHDTIPVKDYFFQQDYGLSTSNVVLVAFDKTRLKAIKDFKLNIGEFGLGTGDMQFAFSKSDLENVPTLLYR